MLPLARYRNPDDPVLLGADGAITAATFFAQAQELAAALPEAAAVINLCETRHGFMLGFAAALLRGQVSLLPPGQGRGDWELLLRQYPGSYLLSECLDERFACAAARGFELKAFLLAAPAAGAGQELRIPQIAAAQIAAILFTSGSTGQPTAHAKTWGQLCRGAAGLAAALNWGDSPSAAVVGSVPPQHMFGLEATVMLPLYAGVAVHAHKPLLPADLEVALAQCARPSWWMTTAMHMRAPLSVTTPMHGLQGVLASTMSLPVAVAAAAEAAWQVPVMEIYGSTETGALAIRRTAAEKAWTPLRGVTVWRAPAETEDGASGIWAAGPHVEPPVHLGDELELLPDGRFLWIGRSSDLIKVGGKRASLAALNQNLLDIAGVDDAAYFVPPAPGLDADADDAHPARRLAAFYVSSTLAPPALLAALRTHLDPVFAPRPLYRVGQLPRNANGKLSQAALASLYRQCRSQPAAGAGAPGSEAPQYMVVAADHPALPGHFPGEPMVPGVVILARVEAAIRRCFPHLELGELMNARFHASLRPDEVFSVHPQLRDQRVRFELRVAAPAGTQTMPSVAPAHIVIASGQWACRAALSASGGKP